MSKTYKGWEILKMTEEGKFKEGDKIHEHDTVYELVMERWVNVNDKDLEVPLNDFMWESEFTIIQQPVAFMEAFTALQNNKNIRVEHIYNVKHFKGNYTEDYLFSESDISRGTWYIEDEQNS